MEFTRVRSPSSFSTGAPFRQRPGGPRSPKSPPGATKDMIPLDLTARVEEATPAYSSPRSSTWSPSSPALASEQDLYSEYGGSSSSRRNTVSRGIQTGMPVPVPSTPSTPLIAAPAVKVIKKTPTLSPPPAVSFDAPPVPWRAMTLEAAQWSLTSEQLQEIVSTAIRTSAQEDFIRLVSRHTLDVELVQELERLDSLKATTQAQYRFNTQRRLMLLQSLNALSFAPGDPSSQEALSNLTAQLAALAASCDRLMETLLTVAEQRAQIQRLQDVHVASALAITLRKLNASYGRRVNEAKEGRAKIAELQAELEEAWGVAEELAQEMDDLDNFGRDFGYEGDEVIEDEASAVSGEGSVVLPDSRTEYSVQMAEVVGVTATAVSSKAMYATVFPGPIAPSPAQLQVADRTSRVMAARRRSVRASKASLRLRQPSMSEGESSPSVAAAAQTARRARSRSRSRRRPTISTEPDVTVPAVPIIRVEPAPCKGGSFLELNETRPTTPSSATQESPPPLPPLPSVSINTTFASTRSTLEVSSPAANAAATPLTPEFDRTLIPPYTFHAARASKDDLFLHNEREREVRALRVQSLGMRERADTVSLFDGVAGSHSSRTPYRKSDGEVIERGRTKAKRYSVPLRAAQVQASQQPRPSTGDAGDGPSTTEAPSKSEIITPTQWRVQQQAGPAPTPQEAFSQTRPDSPTQAPELDLDPGEQPPPLPPKDEAVAAVGLPSEP
ncbi:uncharacterized protein B0H18DRAFT_305828 [Fomitopsis serialis]|uniref:uncharacterized protein n=1 Tax=Fomitopsis serialis TaxID=139415 RepID=UPI00200809BB|nr:uncharacterized protein B0H18DRAFT_305828 [Neoantrodia serialis]KAH9926983.1 hypothetical protein B0H18DRAFT_305828 [Neoantrodia serialis]